MHVEVPKMTLYIETTRSCGPVDVKAMGDNLTNGKKNLYVQASETESLLPNKEIRRNMYEKNLAEHRNVQACTIRTKLLAAVVD